MTIYLEKFMEGVIAHTAEQAEFHQAVREVATYVIPYINTHNTEKYEKYKVLERLVEPERIIIFRIPWMDDDGQVHINRGYRVQMNSALGPYKGGLRFHRSVNLSILKFLAFEQTLKNSLTNMPLGVAKGGSNFDPVGKSEDEVMRFCQAFMSELHRHIGMDTDVPGGDIGVGGREIGYMFGMYRKMANHSAGVLTGRGYGWGGSMLRPEATGYGAVYFTEEMLRSIGEDFEGKTVTVSGYGNAGTYTIDKINQLGGKVVTIADEYGYVYDPEGIAGDKLEFLRDLWVLYRQPARVYAEQFGLKWVAGRRPWEVPCDIAMPTATQNEIDVEDAKTLVKNGCKCVTEVSNMSCTPEAIECFLSNHLLYSPGKASNAGGVAVSGFEMAQNGNRRYWTGEEVDAKLQGVMSHIHAQCVEYGRSKGYTNYVKGANVAAFIRVSDAMLAQGLV